MSYINMNHFSFALSWNQCVFLAETETVRNVSISVPSKHDKTKFSVDNVHFENFLIHDLVPLHKLELFIGLVRTLYTRFLSIKIALAFHSYSDSIRII